MILSVWVVAHDMFSNILGKLGLALSGQMGITGLATAAAVGLGAGVAAIGTASVKAASEYQTQFARIQGLTGSTQEQLDYYNKTLIATSASYDMSASDAAKALYFIVSAGLNPMGTALERAKTNMEVLKYSSMSATASLADQATVADAMTSMMRAYADSNITAADAANTLTRIETYGKATLSSFASSLGFTMVTAKAAGVTMHEAAAGVADLSQVAGQHGVRRVSMEFDNLMRSLLDINAIAKRAKAEGLNFDAATFSTLTLIGKLQYLQHLTGALSSNINDQTYAQMKNMDATTDQLGATAKLDLQLDKANSNFMKLTGGAAAFIPATILLSDSAKNYTDILGQMESKQDIVTAAFDNMRNTLGQTLKMLEMRIQSMLIVIGQQLLPALTAMGKWFTNLAYNVLTFLQSTNGMNTVKNFVLGLAVIIGTVLVPVIFQAVAAAAPFTLALAAIGFAAIKLGQILSDHPAILEKIRTGWDALAPILGRVKDGVIAVLGKLNDFATWATNNEVVFTGLKAVLLVLSGVLINNLVVSLAAGVVGIYSWAASLWAAAAAEAAAFWPIYLAIAVIALLTFGILELVQHWSQVQVFFGNLGKAIGGFFSSLGTAVHNGLALLPGLISLLLQRAGAFILDFFQRMPERIGFLLGFLVGTIIKYLLFVFVQGPQILGRMVFALLLWFGKLVQEAPSKIRDLAVAVFHWLEDMASRALLVVATFVLNLPAKLGELKDAAVVKIKDTANGIWAEIQTWPGKALSAAGDFIQGLINGIQQGQKWVWDAITHLGSGMLDGFKSALGIHSPSQRMHDNGVLVMQGLVNGIASMRGQVAGAFASATSPLTGGLSLGGLSGPTGGTGIAGGLALAGAGRGGDTIHFNLPNATGSPSEIATAIGKVLDERDRNNYRRSRSGAGFGGFRAGLSPTDG